MGFEEDRRGDGPGGDDRDTVACDHEDVFHREGDPEEDSLATVTAALEAERQRCLRVKADFENHKRRTLRERQAVLLYANEKLLRELLPVLDDLQRAVTHAESGGEQALASLVQGIRLILARTLVVLERAGVRPFECLGNPFDPTLHEAVMQQVSEDAPPSSVMEVLETGYRLHTRLLRPAKVVVNARRSRAEVRPRGAEPPPAAAQDAHAPQPPPREPVTSEPAAPEPAAPEMADAREESGRTFEIDEAALGSIEDWEHEFNS
jgi:molecular chaperone GrpE